MKLKRKQIVIGLILVGLVLYLSPNLMSIALGKETGSQNTQSAVVVKNDDTIICSTGFVWWTNPPQWNAQITWVPASGWYVPRDYNTGTFADPKSYINCTGTWTLATDLTPRTVIQIIDGNQWCPASSYGTVCAQPGACYKCVLASPTPPPVISPPTGFSSLISQLLDFLNQVFTSLKSALGLSIVGGTTVNPGSIQSYNINMVEPYPGNYDYSQGVFTDRYCGVALMNNKQEVVSESGFTKCTTNYITTFTATMPSGQFTDYAIVAAMTETKQHYDGTKWVMDYTNKIIQKEALSLTSKVIVPPGSTTPPSFASIIQGIIDWITNLFRSIGLG